MKSRLFRYNSIHIYIYVHIFMIMNQIVIWYTLYVLCHIYIYIHIYTDSGCKVFGNTSDDAKDAIWLQSSICENHGYHRRVEARYSAWCNKKTVEQHYHQQKGSAVIHNSRFLSKIHPKKLVWVSNCHIIWIWIPHLYKKTHLFGYPLIFFIQVWVTKDAKLCLPQGAISGSANHAILNAWKVG